MEVSSQLCGNFTRPEKSIPIEEFLKIRNNYRQSCRSIKIQILSVPTTKYATLG